MAERGEWLRRGGEVGWTRTLHRYSFEAAIVPLLVCSSLSE